MSEVGFESLCQFAPREHDAAAATGAFQPNVRAETRHDLFVGAAGMLLSQAEVIVELQVGEHGGMENGEWRIEVEIVLTMGIIK